MAKGGRANDSLFQFLRSILGFWDSHREMLVDKVGEDREAIDESKPIKTREIGEKRIPPTRAIVLLLVSLAIVAGLSLLPHVWVDGNFVPTVLYKDHPRMFYVSVTSDIFAFSGSYCALFIRNSKPKLARYCEFFALALMLFVFVIFLYAAL